MKSEEMVVDAAAQFLKDSKSSPFNSGPSSNMYLGQKNEHYKIEENKTKLYHSSSQINNQNADQNQFS